MMIGDTKLGYKIVELVGQGGFGTVYKAVKKNKAMETVRALKHISLPSRKEWTDIYNSMGSDIGRTDAYFDSILQEILNEIRILADLTSKGVKNVVWYYENEIEDTPSPKHYDIYLLMEFLTSLPAYIERHEIKVKDVIKIGTDILSALIECHKRNIIHRDIKTDNIFISEDGDYKLGDFGVSKKLSDRSRATSMKGTPNYIAPEVYLGEAYDATVDLYSLGIVLYRLLNYNRNPFMPNYPDSYDSVDEDKAFEMRMAGNVPSYPAFANGALGDVILKAISNKENRYKSAAEFKQALENAASMMTNEQLEVVALENVLSNVDFSTFGSSNELTSMVRDNSQNDAEKSFFGTSANQASMNRSNSISNVSPNVNKINKFIIPAVAAAIVIIAAVAFFALRGGGSAARGNAGKFVEENGITKFLKKNGDYAQNEWVFYEDNEYYFNGRQSLVTNDEVDFNGKTYYVNSDGAKIFNSWYKTSDGKEYYLDSNGEPFKDTAKTINNEVVFFNDKGEKITNDWASYEGDYYYVDSEGVMLKNTFKNLGYNEWYYLGSDGKMLRDTFFDYDNNTYYFESSGKMKADTLFTVGDGIYYAGNDGAIKKGGWCANNQYYAGEDGKILINTTTPDGVRVDSTGRRVQQVSVPVITNPGVGGGSTGGSTGGGSSGGGSNGSENISKGGGVSTGDGSLAIQNVVWGDHLKYTETVYLDEYGEDGGVGKISIDIHKLKEDGTAQVSDVNTALEEIFSAANERAQFELPYKYFELDKTTVSSNNDQMLVIVVTGSIKYTDNTNENMRYKLTLDKAHGNVTYEKVR